MRAASARACPASPPTATVGCSRTSRELRKTRHNIAWVSSRPARASSTNKQTDGEDFSAQAEKHPRHTSWVDILDCQTLLLTKSLHRHDTNLQMRCDRREHVARVQASHGDTRGRTCLIVGDVHVRHLQHDNGGYMDFGRTHTSQDNTAGSTSV
jgi:hypothetical protein